MRVSKRVVAVVGTVIDALSGGVISIHIVGDGANGCACPSDVLREVVGLSGTNRYAKMRGVVSECLRWRAWAVSHADPGVVVRKAAAWTDRNTIFGTIVSEKVGNLWTCRNTKSR